MIGYQEGIDLEHEFIAEEKKRMPNLSHNMELALRYAFSKALHIGEKIGFKAGKACQKYNTLAALGALPVPEPESLA